MDKWKKAGEIAATALEHGRKMIKPGAKIVDILDAVDKKIYDLGAIPAFPSQISLNEVAAHACAKQDDEQTLENEVVKLDCGAVYEGAIGDNAVTVDLSGNYEELVLASREALQAAIATVKPGVELRLIGRAIQEAIEKRGCKPVVNLSGHGLGEWDVHCKPTIPNFDNGDPRVIEEGMVFAIEPFATNGKGRIHESGEATVLHWVQDRPNRVDRSIVSAIKSFHGLPFALRWLTRKFSPGKVKLALRQLEQQEIIRAYPPLVEVSGGMVSQAEHSVRVTQNGCEVLTQL